MRRFFYSLAASFLVNATSIAATPAAAQIFGAG